MLLCLYQNNITSTYQNTLLKYKVCFYLYYIILYLHPTDLINLLHHMINITRLFFIYIVIWNIGAKPFNCSAKFCISIPVKIIKFELRATRRQFFLTIYPPYFSVNHQKQYRLNK